MKTHAARHGDPRHHADDIAKLKAENRRLRMLLRYLMTALNEAVDRETKGAA